MIPERLSNLLHEPQAGDDKYSRGVLGFVTGSERFPGAAILGVTAAIRTGVGMIRHVAPVSVTNLLLEVRPESVAGFGRAQAWVLGSGVPVDDEVQVANIREAASQNCALVIDAGALELIDYSSLAPESCILTPHAGELARLLDRFGGFNGVITAPSARLSQEHGVGDAVILELKIVEAAARRLARARVMHRPVISSWNALLEYCQTAMAHRETEQFRVFFLDRKNTLIADEAQAQGTVDHVPVYPREVVKRALELNACALILVHNHPSGDPTPSASDIEMTKQIERAASALGISLHNHLVIGRSREISFKSEGLL